MTGCVFVTGGAGYIGSHACKLLAQSGYMPVALDNLATGWQEAVKFGPFEQVDLLDREALDAAFSHYAPEAVMHFAAFSDVGKITGNFIQRMGAAVGHHQHTNTRFR